jgi:hypothetical protein
MALWGPKHVAVTQCKESDVKNVCVHVSVFVHETVMSVDGNEQNKVDYFNNTWKEILT